MGIKFVYAIISSVQDYIIEQAFVSMYSLKKHNPEAHITLVTDQATFESIVDNRGRINAYFDEVIIENPPSHFNATERSRFLKTSLRRLIKGDFLYLDNDTIIMDSLKHLENFPGELGAIKDHHREVIKDGRIIHGQIINYLIKTKKKFWGFPIYYNGGVFLARDTKTTHRFFDHWHNLWTEEREKYGIQIDQPSFAQANCLCDNIITELPGEYNIQLIFIKQSLPFYGKQKIVHYFTNSEKSKNYPLNLASVLESIRGKGISPEIEELIEFPLKPQLDNALILTGNDREMFNTPLVILARIMGKKHKWLQTFARFLFKVANLPLD